MMRNLNNADIKKEANEYATENSSENFREVRDAHIEGFNNALDKLAKEYTEVDVEYLGRTIKALVERRKL